MKNNRIENIAGFDTNDHEQVRLAIEFVNGRPLICIETWKQSLDGETWTITGKDCLYLYPEQAESLVALMPNALAVARRGTKS